MRTLLGALAVACLLICNHAQAADFFSKLKQVPVDFGGFFSQGVITTTDNNYLGDTDGEVSARFREAAINATFSPLKRTTVSAQAFVMELGPGVGGMSDVLLDYAFADYSVNEWIGFRAGRIKRPQGIYNTIRDVDVVRTSILLPQGIYDNRWRDFFSYIDGGSAYGYIAGGTVEYEVYYGTVQLDSEGGLGSFLLGEFPGLAVTDVNLDGPAYGGQVWYNTPIMGLRAGQAVSYFKDSNIDLFHPYAGAMLEVIDASFFTTSLQYMTGNWTFEAEFLSRLFETIDPVSGVKVSETKGQSWYISATYQINDKLALGAYYTEFAYDVDSNSPRRNQDEVVVSARYDLSDNWVIKVEAHKVDGYGLLYNDRGQNLNPSDDWWIFSSKVSFSF
ncbi:MAG: hypothetical protein AB3N63_00865 [Puniceicoccaceae bacterium]